MHRIFSRALLPSTAGTVGTSLQPRNSSGTWFYSQYFCRYFTMLTCELPNLLLVRVLLLVLVLGRWPGQVSLQLLLYSNTALVRELKRETI